MITSGNISTPNYFTGVTLLITHYNRSASLERLLSTCAKLNLVFEDIVVSDDGSKAEHLSVVKKLKETYNFQLICTEKNKGLGNNINKGQDAVKTPFTLYVQEDFVPTSAFSEQFGEAVTIMKNEEKWDIIRFYSYFSYPYLKQYRGSFSEICFRWMPWFNNHLKFYAYSDHPHLRRSSFLEKFGRYVEGENVDYTEFRMCLSFIKNKGKGLFASNFSGLFDQCNNASEPSTASYRSDWKQSKNSVITFLRWIYLKYRFLKNNLQLIFLHLSLK